jgi:hypothetical protein
MAEPSVNAEFLLAKFPGKGGWTYAELSELSPDKKNPFGWLRVRGTIDGYEIHQYHLMPMGNGHLFLPVKAAIRKKIKKEAGDSVFVCLYLEEQMADVPAELRECLGAASPKALAAFETLAEEHQKQAADRIYRSTDEEERVKQIVLLIEKLERNA